MSGGTRARDLASAGVYVAKRFGYTWKGGPFTDIEDVLFDQAPRCPVPASLAAQ
jgi:hypothetical protein